MIMSMGGGNGKRGRDGIIKSAKTSLRQLPFSNLEKGIYYILFLLSGVSGLIYEVLWLRIFTNVFGNTTYSASVVLAAYMAGLALGSIFIGRVSDRKSNLLSIFAIVEICIGLSALAIPFVSGKLNYFYKFLFNYLSDSALLLIFVKGIISFVIMFIPTFLMGGTLPLIGKYLVRDIDQSGRIVGLLYGFNTLGATLGCFITGFFLLEHFGIVRSVSIGAFVNIFLGLIFLLLSKVYKKTDIDYHEYKRRKKEGVKHPISEKRNKNLILISYGFYGFVALSYEILWMRLLELKLHTTVYAFTIMLTTFLLGLGVGGVIFSVIDKLKLIRNHNVFFGLLEVLIGLFGLSLIFVFANLEYISSFSGMISWQDQIKQQFLISGLIMLFPTTLMGMLFPAANKIYIDDPDTLGKSVGYIYSSNTVGGILGSIVTGFFLVRLLGTQYSIQLISFIALVVGSVNVFNPYKTSKPKAITLFLLSLMWILAVLFSVILPRNYLMRYYNITEKEVNSRVKILYAFEGIEGITSVHEYPDGSKVLTTGSTNVAGTDFTLRTTQKLQAHIPMLLHHHPVEVLQVGFGSGETSHILTMYETAKVDVVEISLGVIDAASKYFLNINSNVFSNPKFRLILMDGANYIFLTDRKYDVIMNDSIWPFYSGNASLYTLEYFKTCREHLKKGGIMTSWLPIELPLESFKILLNTFSSVFPYVSLWVATTHYNKHALLVGSMEPLKIDLNLFLERFYKYAEKDLEIVNLNDPVLFLSTYKMDQDGFSNWFGNVPINTVDKPILEFSPRLAVPNMDKAKCYELVLNNSSSVISHLFSADTIDSGYKDFIEKLKSCERANQHFMRGLIMRERGEGEFIDEFENALALWPNHPGVLFILNEVNKLESIDISSLGGYSFVDLINIGEKFLRNKLYGKAIMVFGKAINVRPNSALAHYNLASAYLGMGKLNEALREMNKAVELQSNTASFYNTRGMIYFKLGKVIEAIKDFTRAIKINPGYAIVYNSRGIAYASIGKAQKALEDFNRAIDLDTNYIEAYYNRGLLYQTQWKKLYLNENTALIEAVKSYTKAISLNPNYIKAYSNRGIVYALQGQFQLAIKDFNKIIELKPDQADAYYNRGLVYEMCGDHIKANKDFNKAIELNPDYKDRFKNQR